MATQEFYIRSATETEARGPFTQDQLVSLAEAEQVTLETLYYDAGTEQWVAVGANPELKSVIFPEKKKLSIKAKEKIKTLNVEKEGDAPITVQQMLAAAEGKTDETKDKKDPAIAQARCAAIGIWALTAFFFASAATLILPYIDQVAKLDPMFFLQQPFVILGALDIVLGILMILQVSSFYPVIRFRAALGLGFLGVFFWLHGVPSMVLAVTGISVGMYFCTVFVSYVPLFTAIGIGLAGMAGFALYMLT